MNRVYGWAGGVEEAGPSPSVFDPEWGQYDTAADLKSGMYESASITASSC